MPADVIRNGLLFLLLTAACLWPAPEAVVLTGIPLSPLGLASALALVLIALMKAAPPRAWILAAAVALVVAKIAALPLVLPAGWAARYYANGQFQEPFERALTLTNPPWTRLERALRFEPNGFPLHFLNEIRFNYWGERRTPPFSASYTGYVRVPAGARLRVGASAVSAVEIVLDGRPLMTHGAADSGVFRHAEEVSVSPGVHRLDVRYAAASYSPRALRVDVSIAGEPAGGGGQPLLVRPVNSSERQETVSRWVNGAIAGIDVLLLALIGGWLVITTAAWMRAAPEDSGGRITPLALATSIVLAVIGVVLCAWWRDVPATLAIISSGHDGVVYETYARRIVLDNWLLDTGKFAGKPLLYTIGYHLWLTAVHLLFGESLWAAYFVQDWMLWAAVCLSAATAIRIMGWPAGLIAFAAGVYFRTSLFWPVHYIARENLVVLLNAALVFVFSAPMTRRRSVTAGTIAGANFIADPINLLALPALLWFVRRLAPPERWRPCVIAFGAAWLVFFLLVPIRNAIVTGVPWPMPSEGAPTLWWGNRPPPSVYPDPPPNEGYYRAVWRYATAEPRHLFTELVKKTVYSAGFYWAMLWPFPEANQVSLVITVTWIVAIIGAARTIRGSPPGGTLTQLIVLLALIRLASMIVFIAHHRYGTTLAMLMLPIVGSGLLVLWRAHRLLPVLAVLVIAGDHLRADPGLGGYARFTSPQLLGPISHHGLRRQLDWTLPLDAPLGWRFPASAGAWPAATGNSLVAGVVSDTAVYQLLGDGEAGLVSPPLKVPAPLVRAIRIEAAFSGWAHIARIEWRRKDGKTATKNASAYFEVDRTGRTRTYEIPVWRSTEWTDVIEQVKVLYDGDTVVPRHIELVAYPDVSRRPTAR